MRNSLGICAGVVTYNPDVELLSRNLKALLPQVDEILIVDNGSDNVDMVDSLIQHEGRISLYKNRENLGIAKALNQLCSETQHRGYQWILTMDQDSVCHQAMVENLSAYTKSHDYGIIAPRVEFWDNSHLNYSTRDGNLQTIEIQACITSGSLTKIEAWESVGGFDEWMFIDRVDNDFCVRLGILGYHILRVNAAILYQRAGEMKHITLPLIGTLLLPYYNEKRNYYICRNSVYYFRKYYKHIDLCHQIGAFVYSLLIKFVFEPHRWSTMKSTIRGMHHGFVKVI